MEPDWLCRPREEWPKFECKEKGKGVLEEERKSATMLVQVRAPAGIGVVVDVSKYSTAERLFTVTAWLVRFIFNL